MTRESVMPLTAETFGVLADGAVKVLLAGLYAVGAWALSSQLDVAPWLLIACATALLIGGGSELGYLRSRPTRTYLPLMIAYDSGWVLVTIVSLLSARQDIRWAGELWIGYQTVAPLAFAAALAAGSRSDARIRPR
ncbi:hypothetical protein [Nocardia nova]|uniref:hypothetical protein n=1 Tax=Nocardia nova TaxID=37330 RepID=UPI0033DE9935